MPADPVELQQHDIVFMLQHPNHEPLAQSSGTVLAINENTTRVRHDANTLGGSSGSPVFAHDLSLVALHHVGDPNYAELHRPKFNQAVPIGKIAQQIKTRGVELVGDLSP